MNDAISFARYRVWYVTRPVASSSRKFSNSVFASIEFVISMPGFHTSSHSTSSSLSPMSRSSVQCMSR